MPSLTAAVDAGGLLCSELRSAHCIPRRLIQRDLLDLLVAEQAISQKVADLIGQSIPRRSGWGLRKAPWDLRPPCKDHRHPYPSLLRPPRASSTNAISKATPRHAQ